MTLDLKNYIDSGVIERFLLGLATPEQERELMYMRRLHPVLEQEIAMVELQIENQLVAEAVLPPANLKDAVLAQARRHKQREKYYSSEHKPEQPAPDPVYINLKPGWNRLMTVSIWWRCAFLAICVLAMALAASTWHFYNRAAQLEEVLIKLKTPAAALPSPTTH